MSLNKIQKLNDHTFVLSQKAQAVVEFVPGVTPSDNVDGPRSVSVKNTQLTAGYKIAKWGVDNLKPSQMMKLVRDNHIKPQLLLTERDFIMGSRLGHFKERYENGKRIIEHVDVDQEVLDWEDEVGLDNYWFAVCSNWVHFRNIPNFASLDSKTKKVASLSVIDCLDIRKEVFINGITNQFFIHPNWGIPVQDQIKILPAFDKTNPVKFGEFVYWVQDHIPGQPYYTYPAWWGTENWTRVSNNIPAFHVAGLENGYNLKYHIKVPYEYLLKLTAGNEDPKELMKKREELVQSMDGFLSGVKNKDKTFISFSFKDNFGKEALGWEIIPLDNKMTDDAYVKLDEHANVNQTSGHGVDPSLAGIDTGRGLGKSGSELRITYDTHIALRTPQPRQRCTEFLNKVVMKLNGWKDKGFFYGVEDVQMTTLDVNPTGRQGVVNQSM